MTSHTVRITLKSVLSSILLWGLTFAFSAPAAAQELTEEYVPDDYSWTTQSRNSSGSMPCGGNSVGLNVWAENGDILFYAQRSGAFDENNTLLKAGRFRIRLFEATGSKSSRKQIKGDEDFLQTLHLYDGYVSITTNGVRVDIWADVFKPVIHVELTSPRKITATVSYESWRYRDRPIRKLEFQQCSYKFGKNKGLTTKADSIEPSKSSIWFYHVNPDSTVFDATAIEQGLGPLRKEMYNPIGGLISGGMMTCPDFRFTGTENGTYASTDYRAWTFTTRGRVKNTSIAISLGDTQEGLEAFRRDIAAQLLGNATQQRDDSRQWWHQFWQRSYVKAQGEAAGIVRNYTLFRYMLGCNAYGKWPTKFNGGLFTFDPVYVDAKYPFTPDFRRWGGGTFTAQNQRLVYWPMLRSGDFDMLTPQLDFYLRILPTAMLRARTYWKHGGAYFNEQIENFGLPNIDEYGAKRPEGFDQGVEYNAWLEYTWDTALEFCQMALEANRMGGTDIAKYVPMIKECVRFFDEHYQWQAKRNGRKALDGDGHLIIYPGSGCETFKMAYNPASTVAGLKVVIGSLCQYLKANNATADTIAEYEAMLNRIPPIPTRFIDGHETIAPAVVWARVNNRELPQLYPVFPWHVYGVGHDSLSVALNTWRYDPYVKEFKGITSWEQANIFAADLGLTDEAATLEAEKMKDGPYRFPAFWGPGHDWAPDHNWGGSGMIGLQEMLLQTDSEGKDITKPAWPESWPVEFKLVGATGESNSSLTRASQN